MITVPYATRTEGHYHASRGGEEELLEGGYSETWHSGSIIPGREASETRGGHQTKGSHPEWRMDGESVG